MINKKNIPIRRRLAAIFIIALIFSSATQLTLWHSYTIFDATVWRPRIKNMAHDLSQRPLNFDIKNSAGEYRYSGHPGMSVVFIGSLLQLAHPALINESLPLSLVILDSFIIAALTVTAYFLRPRSLWWVTVAIIFSFHPLFFYSTPTNAVTALLLTLFFLLSLFIYEKKQLTPLPLIFLLGFVLGVSLVTRAPDTMLLATPFLIFLYPSLRLHRSLVVIIMALLGALLFDPLLWFSPLNQFGLIFYRTGYHITHNYDYTLSLTEFLLFSPLSLISVVFGLVLLAIYKHKLVSIPQRFLTLILFLTATNTTIFLSAPWQSLRYFFPLFFIWDALFPLFIIHLIKYFRFEFSHRLRQNFFSYILPPLFKTITISTIIFGHIYLLLYNLFIGFYRGLI